jgi:signal transduction histidine kinase
VLRVEDTGPHAAPDVLGRMFEPQTRGREGTDSLELAACNALARRQEGTVRAENLPGGGFAVVVEFPARRATSL